MSLKALQQAIQDAAQKEADVVASRFADQATKEKQRITEAATKLEESILEAAQHAGQLEATRSHQDQLLSTKASILASKQEQLHKLEQELVTQLLNMEAAEAKALLKQLFRQLPKEKGEIMAGAKHAAEIAALAKANANLSLAKEQVAADGGFVYRNAATEINLTISELVHRVFEKHKAAIAAQLFS